MLDRMDTHTHTHKLLRLLVLTPVRCDLPDGRCFSIVSFPVVPNYKRDLFQINSPTILWSLCLTFLSNALLRLLVLCTLRIFLDLVMLTVVCLSDFRLTSHIFRWHPGNILLELVLGLSHLLPLWYQNWYYFSLAPVKGWLSSVLCSWQLHGSSMLFIWQQIFFHVSGINLPCF